MSGFPSFVEGNSMLRTLRLNLWGSSSGMILCGLDRCDPASLVWKSGIQNVWKARGEKIAVTDRQPVMSTMIFVTNFLLM